MIHADDLPLRLITEPSSIRLISTAYIEEPALDPLADDDDDLAILEEIQSLTSPAKSRPLTIPSGLDPTELLTSRHGNGWRFINDAFCYIRETGNRFNGAERGAWYAAYGDDAVQTAQAEVSWHLSRELRATGIVENTTAYCELLAGVTAEFHDLNSVPAGDILHKDPAIAYPAGQALAREIQSNGGNGLLYPSVRRDGGNCLAAFKPYLVQNVRLGDTWIFEWAGSETPTIKLG